MQPFQVGRHSFRREGDIVYIKYVSGVTLEEMVKMEAISQTLQTEPGNIYLVYDVSEAGLMTPEARRYAAEKSKDLLCSAIVIYGTTLFTRAAIALVLSAVKLIAKRVPETAYVKDEAAARAWIAAHRLRGT